MPTARRIATPRNSARIAQQQAAVDLAARERRQHDVVGGPAEHPRVGHGQRAEEHAAERGEGEDQGLALDRDPEYGEALARRRSAWLRLHVRHLGALPPPVLARTSDRQGIPRRQPLTSGRYAAADPYARRMTRALLARRERAALCDLALVLGEDAPTLCGAWTAKDLVAHLLVRERSPLAVSGSGAAAVRRCPSARWPGWRARTSRCWSSGCAATA